MRAVGSGDRDRFADVARAFTRTAVAVERGKEELLRAIPSARAPGVPMAEALLSYREALQEAEESMPAWRRPELQAEWDACREGLQLALREEERLRLAAPAFTHEGMLAALGDLIAPLEAFADASARLSRLRKGRT
jgi:hypothetical protein